MGTPSDDTYMGIVTLVDKDYNYVWHSNLGPWELRYPVNPDPEAKFQPGELVRFVQSHDTKSIQVVHNLMRYQTHTSPAEPFKDSWKWEVKLIFAPSSAKEYKQMMENDNEDRVRAVAFADQFNLVASFVDGVDYEPNVVYTAYITRFPKGHETYAREIGTIFCILGKRFHRVTDTDEAAKMIRACPWLKSTKNANADYDSDNETGLPQLPTPQPPPPQQQNIQPSANKFEKMPYSNGTGDSGYRDGANTNNYYTYNNNDHDQTQQQHSKQQQASSAQVKRELYNEEPEANYAQELHEVIEGQETLGIVVHCAKEYSAIWCRKYALVRIQIEQDPNLPKWPIAQWVYFRCMPEASQLQGGVRCSYTAYELRKSDQVHRDAMSVGKTVAVQMSLTKAESHSNMFFLAEDNLFGPVLCSLPDSQFSNQFDQPDGTPQKPVEIYAMYTDAYRFSKWVAFAYKPFDGETFKKIGGLPDSIECDIKGFFKNKNQQTYQQPQPMQERTDEAVGATKFKPPSDWQGIKREGNMIKDILGLVTCFEDDGQTSVIATQYGLARQPTKMEMGTWVRANIVPMENPSRKLENKMDDLGAYDVVWSKKIGPPLYTRVINDKGVEKLLVCCNVKVGANCHENDYLGKIEDPTNCIKLEQNNLVHQYLVEISFSRRSKYEQDSRYWKILKNHGEYTKCVHMVALKLSFFPKEEGKTCDDAYRVLRDQIFDAVEYRKKKGLPPMNMNACSSSTANENNNFTSSSMSDFQTNATPTRSRERQMPSTSSGPANDFYSTPLAYQPKTPQMGHPFSFEERQQQLHQNEGHRLRNGTGITHRHESTGILAQLDDYVPVPDTNTNEKEKRSLCIVVTKNTHFAIVYSMAYGDSILLRRYFQSQTEYDKKVQLGNWLGVTFARVLDQQHKQLTYSHMCLPEFVWHHNKESRTPKVPTRLVLGQFIQLRVKCIFNKENVKECIEGLKPMETERRYYVVTTVGKVLLNPQVVDKNDLFGKSVNLWVTHIQKNYGCYWQLVLNEASTLEESNDPDGIEIMSGRPPGHPKRLAELFGSSSSKTTNEFLSGIRDRADAINAYEQPQTQAVREDSKLTGAFVEDPRKLYYTGYGDFLYGAKGVVADPRGGERYRTERYRPREINDEVDEDVSDPEEIDDRALSSSTDDEDTGSVESVGSNNHFELDDADLTRRLRQIGRSSPSPPIGSTHENWPPKNQQSSSFGAMANNVSQQQANNPQQRSKKNASPPLLLNFDDEIEVPPIVPMSGGGKKNDDDGEKMKKMHPQLFDLLS